MLSQEDVHTIYRAILGRDPEHQGIVDSVVRSDTPQLLSERLLASDEFRRRLTQGLLKNTDTKWVCAEIRYGLKLWIDLLDLGVASGVLQDDWEAAETNFILSVLEPGDVFLDVGANVGWFSILAARAVGPTGQVHAFEARPDLADRLRESVAINGFSARCSVHAVALGAEQGSMRIASVPAEHNPGHSFLVSGELPEGAEVLGTVEVRPLDAVTIDRPVRLIKVDVEGAEGLVLRGATDLIRRDQPIIVSEIFPKWLGRVSNMHPSAYLDVLQGHGYRVFLLTEGGIGREVHRFSTEPDVGIGEYTNVVALPSRDVVRFLNQALDRRVDDLEATVTRLQSASNAGSDDVLRKDGLRAELEQVRAELKAAQAADQANAAPLVEEARAETERVRAALRQAGVLSQQAEAVHQQTLGKLVQELAQSQNHLAAVLGSTSWRATMPLREVGLRTPPEVNKFLTRAARAAWWTATLQLPKRLRLRREVRSNHGGAPPSSIFEPASVGRQGSIDPPVLRGVTKPVAFIIDQCWPTPDRDGGSIDAINLTTSLTLLGYHVIFATTADVVELAPYRAQLEDRGVRCFGREDGSSIQEFIERHGEAIALFALTRVTAGGQYLELIRYNWPRAKIMFVTVDLHFLREERQAKLLGDATGLVAAQRTRDREQFLVLKADVTIVVSPDERELLVNAVPGSNVVELPLARETRQAIAPFAQRRDIGFVGGFKHAPNVDAVRSFLSDVWPLVRVSLPDCRFVIAGESLPDDVLKGMDDRVVYLGHVPDLDAWFDQLRLTVAPIRYGAGLKGKVLSSITAGVPCIGSRIAMEGLALRPEEGALTAESPELMCSTITSLYDDETRWTAMSTAGQRKTKQSYSLEANHDRMAATLIGIGLPSFTIDRRDDMP